MLFFCCWSVRDSDLGNKLHSVDETRTSSERKNRHSLFALKRVRGYPLFMLFMQLLA